MTSLTLPPGPDGFNASRAATAFVALRAFADASRTDWENALTDLPCDLMHFADRAPECDFGLALDRAQMHYEAETAGEVL